MSVRAENGGGFLKNPTRRQLLQSGLVLFGVLPPLINALTSPRPTYAGANTQVSDYLDIELFFDKAKQTSPDTAQWSEDLTLKGHHFVPLDRSIPFMQGFTVRNDGQVPMWNIFRDKGGVSALGFPISNRYDQAASSTQAFQKGVLAFNNDSGTANFIPFAVANNQNPSISSPDMSDSDTDLVQSQQTQPESIDLNSIPQLAYTPKYLQVGTLPSDMRCYVGGNGYLLDNWNKAANIYDVPVWKLMLDAQTAYLKATDNYLPLPGVAQTSLWDKWASEENPSSPSTQALLQKMFFADAPFDGKVEQRAIAALNAKRNASGLPSVRLNAIVTQAARANCIVNLVNRPALMRGDSNPSDLIGITSNSQLDLLKYFGGPNAATCGVVFGDSADPENALDDLWRSTEPHQTLSLVVNQKSPLDWGYAEASVCWPAGKIVQESHQDMGVICALP